MQQEPKSSEKGFVRAGECLKRCKSSGIYYAWFKRSGKQIHHSLQTTNKARARRLLADKLREYDEPRHPESRSIIFETVAARWLESVRADGRKDATITRLQSCIDNLSKQLFGPLHSLTPEMCDRWKIARAAKVAPQTFAHELGALKRILSYAVEHGMIYRNPARAMKRPRILRTRPRVVPTATQVAQIVQTIRHSDGRPESQAIAKAGADFVELLALSGMRCAEAASLTWSEVDFARGFLTVSGGSLGTKNYESRTVPLFPELRAFLARLKAEGNVSPDSTVARIQNPKKCLHTACRKLFKTPRPGEPNAYTYFSPHSFRHFFTTHCLEQNAPVTTVARWLGHKDGGALLMRTYSHLMQAHSLEAASKLRFAPSGQTMEPVVEKGQSLLKTI